MSIPSSDSSGPGNAATDESQGEIAALPLNPPSGVPLSDRSLRLAGQNESDPANTHSLLQGDEHDIRGLKPLEEFAYPWWYYGVSCLAVLLVGFAISRAISFWLKHRRKKPWTPPPPPPPPEPLHLVILRRFEEVRKNMGASNLHRTYFDVSEIFRDYLEGRYLFPASDWTTEEIVNYVMASPKGVAISRVDPGDCFAGARNDIVREILTQLDEVKFAGREPDRTHLTGLIDQAERFVTP